MALPTSGAAWSAMVSAANALGAINIGDQNETDDVRALAAALVAVRTGGSTTALEARLAAAVGTEGSNALAVARNVMPVVLAADLIGYRPASFTAWVSLIRSKVVDGRSLISTHNDRPNNWGTHAGASRIAADLYLGSAGAADLTLAIRTFRGWLGDRAQYAGFDYGDLSWQSNPSAPVGVNPVGAVIQGRNVDGVLPDDQRRASGFQWPPPCENYVYEALQGALMQAELLYQAGQPAYGWSNGAIGRSYVWLHGQAACPAAGDDTWQPPLVNERLGTSYPASTPSQFGKNMGFTDWLYGG